jgi:aminoglycoside phosphotransferase (APT) family kinase protein
VISWGDARIGNVMYASDGFEPVAVFDWEMASLGPPELDLGWMVFLHSFFQEIAVMLERPGLPDFMRRDDVVETYCARSGTTVGDLHWFEVYAATRHAVIMSRIRDRSVRFGEATWPDDIDEVIPHRALLRRMIEV